MSAKVSSFINVNARGYRHVFMLVAWNEYAWAVRDEMNRQAEAFGKDLGEHGLFVQPYDGREYDTAAQVLAKDWPKAIKRRLDEAQEPALLILGTDFAAFNPTTHDWALIWLSDFDERPREIMRALAALAHKTRQGEDVIRFLHETARASRAGAIARSVNSVVKLKPGLFGVSLDVNALLGRIGGQANVAMPDTHLKRE